MLGFEEPPTLTDIAASIDGSEGPAATGDKDPYPESSLFVEFADRNNDPGRCFNSDFLIALGFRTRSTPAGTESRISEESPESRFGRFRSGKPSQSRPFSRQVRQLSSPEHLIFFLQELLVLELHLWTEKMLVY